MAGENSPEARAKADTYAKQQTAQARLQLLNAKVNTPMVKVNTKNQAETNARLRNQAKNIGGKTLTPKSGPNNDLANADDYLPDSALNKSWNTPNGGIQNPKFIYPGYYNRDAVNRKETPIERGYIRRLTEFYAKDNAQVVKSGKANASTIKNMKCNFQFNPDNITRMVTAESDMQFFFNQDPSQLAQPIPGKAGFAFELLFNREAEVTTQRYLVGDKTVKANFKENITNTKDFLDPTKPYDPAWVTRLGVLADILILDDVIGQGLAKDIYNAMQAKQVDANGKPWGFSADSPNSPTTATTTTSGSTTTTSKTIDADRYNAYSMNIGNKAFLTPTPVRILFTKWMMVEGFVQSIQVTFNKFSTDMIPTQATVMIQMQALYIGFAQQNTFLTQLPDIDVGNNNIPVPTTPSVGDLNYDRYKEYDDELKKKDFFSKQFYINYSPWNDEEMAAVKFKDIFNAPSNTIDFAIEKTNPGIGANGEAWINKWKKQGKNFNFIWDGVLKIYWDSHVAKSDGSSIPRATSVVPVSDVYAGATKLIPGHPATQNKGNANETDFTLYGTKSNPWVYKTEGNVGKAYLSFGSDYIETNPGAALTNKWTDNDGQLTSWDMILENGRDKLLSGNALSRPFAQDKFTFELGIRWRIEDDVIPDQPVFLYDWHYAKTTLPVDFGTGREWFLAYRNGDYRNVITQGNTVTGTGVSFFAGAKI